MLVRRRVEDHLGTKLREHAVQPGDVGDVAQHGADAGRQPLVGEQVGDGVQVVLTAFVEHQGVRPQGGNLQAQFGADRTAGAGDQHPSAHQELAQRRFVEADRGARQQILDGQSPNLIDA